MSLLHVKLHFVFLEIITHFVSTINYLRNFCRHQLMGSPFIIYQQIMWVKSSWKCILLLYRRVFSQKMIQSANKKIQQLLTPCVCAYLSFLLVKITNCFVPKSIIQIINTLIEFKNNIFDGTIWKYLIPSQLKGQWKITP